MGAPPIEYFVIGITKYSIGGAPFFTLFHFHTRKFTLPDLKNIENNLKSDDPPTDTICFHAQQAIEKYIKGALIYFGKHITKTHDLVNLLTSISAYIPELEVFEDKLHEISRYGVEVRYPDIFYEPSLEEAKSAFEVALKVKDIVLSKIKI